MAFRDDREALRAKASSLERELADTRDELEDAKKKLDERVTKRRAVKARSLLTGARRWLERHKVLLTTILIAIAALGAGYAVYAQLSSTEDPLPAILFTGQGHVTDVHGQLGIAEGDDCEVWIEPHQGEHNCRVHVTCGGNQLYSGFTYCSVVAGEAVSADDTAYGTDGDAALHFDRDASRVVLEDATWGVTVSLGSRPARVSGLATWTAVVERTVRSDVALDAECTLAAQIVSDGYRPSAVEVTVQCGGLELYRSARDTPGEDWRILEGPAPAPGSYEYALRYEDRDGDPLHTRASIDTMRRRARVWRDADPPTFVEFRVEDVSAPREAEPFERDNHVKRARFRETVDVPLVVSAADIGAPVAVGETCRFQLRPVWSRQDHNCRLAVLCGHHFLYGGGEGGFASCSIIDGVPVASTSDSDDLRGLRYQRGTGVVSLRSFDVARPWVIELRTSATAPNVE